MTKRRIDIGGIVAYWTSSETNLATLRERLLEREPESERFMPEATAPMNALREALQEVYPDKLIRSLKRKGFAIIDEERGEKENEYGNVASVWIDEGSLVFSASVDRTTADAVRFKYDLHRFILQPAQAGALLAKLIGDYLGGTMLRPKTGGIYWLPDTLAERFMGIATAFETAGRGGTTVYTIRHAMDEAACKAVHDAIVYEMAMEAKKLNEQIATGELGEKALATKGAEADQLMEKVSRYEEMLQTDLKAARDALGAAKDAAAAAALLAANEADAAAETASAGQ